MIKERAFGQTKSNEAVKEFEMRDGDFYVRVMDYGATITSICVPNRKNESTEITLGFDDLKGYEQSRSCFGATCGRYGNRIGYSSFWLNGDEYKLFPNNGPHSLHGGRSGFNRKKWASFVEDDKVKMRYESPDMEEGYPGNLTVTATFSLAGQVLSIDYCVMTDKDTIANIINHTYFNLNGHSSGDILDHEVLINADHYCKNDEYGMASGIPAIVEGTPFDFHDWNVVGERINDCDELLLAKGYDHNYCVNKSADCFVASVRAASGISLSIFSDLPGLQFYTGNNIVKEYGRNGCTYFPRSGLCLETQEYPDAINNPSFPSPIIKYGTEKHFMTKYIFRID